VPDGHGNPLFLEQPDDITESIELAETKLRNLFIKRLWMQMK